LLGKVGSTAREELVISVVVLDLNFVSANRAKNFTSHFFPGDLNAAAGSSCLEAERSRRAGSISDVERTGVLAETALVGRSHSVRVHCAGFPCLVNELVTVNGLDNWLASSFFCDEHLVVASISNTLGRPLNGDGTEATSEASGCLYLGW